MNTGGRANALAPAGTRVNPGYGGRGAAVHPLMAIAHAAQAHAEAQRARAGLRSALTALIAQHLSGQMQPGGVNRQASEVPGGIQALLGGVNQQLGGIQGFPAAVPPGRGVPAAIGPMIPGRNGAAPARQLPNVGTFANRFAQNRRRPRMSPYINF